MPLDKIYIFTNSYTLEIQPITLNMKKITSLLSLLLLTTFAMQGQEKFSAMVEMGLGIPFVELNGNTYQGYKPNIGISGGVGYDIMPNLRLRADVMAIQLNGNNDASYFQAQAYEGSASVDYNILGLFNKNSKYMLNARGGVGAGFANSNLYDINTRQKITEVPAQNVGGSSYSIQTFILAGLNLGIPVSDKIAINVGYAHRVLWFQPWLDAFNANSFDTYGVLTAGLHFNLKSDRDKSKIEVDPKKYNALKAKADSTDRFEAQANRNAERIGRLEMSNQEKDMQIAMLQGAVDSLKANPIVVKGEVTPGKKENMVVRNQSSDDIGPERYRVVVVSSPTRAGAQKFIDRSKLDKEEMMIAYIERLDTYRVIYKSTDAIEAAKKHRDEARKYYSDAWIAKF